jgi:hypothetical protein
MAGNTNPAGGPPPRNPQQNQQGGNTPQQKKPFILPDTEVARIAAAVAALQKAPAAANPPTDSKSEPKCPPTDKSKDEKPKGSGWYATGPTWFFNAIGFMILVIFVIASFKLMFPDGVNTVHGFVPTGSGLTPIPEAERHPALRDAFDASRVRNTKDGFDLSNFPPAVVEKIRAGARAVHVLSTNKVWSLYPPPYSAGTTVQIP